MAHPLYTTEHKKEVSGLKRLGKNCTHSFRW